MEDTFTIQATFEDFVSWLDGHTRRTLEAWRRAEVMTWQNRTSAIVIAHATQIAFTVQAEDESTVTMRAELWTAAEPTPEARQWLAGTMDAIGRKWPQKSRKKSGRHKMECNAWAEERAKQGKTVDDILADWCELYAQEQGAERLESLASPREYLAEIMRRATPKK